MLITWSLYSQPIGNSAVEALDLLNAAELGDDMAASLFIGGRSESRLEKATSRPIQPKIY